MIEHMNPNEPVVLLPTKKIIEEGLCAMQLLRMLGFSADDLYLIFGSHKDDQDVSILLKGTDKSFVIQIGVTAETKENFSKKWIDAATAWNTMEDTKAMELFMSSDIRKNAVNIMGLMLSRGFKFNLPSDITMRQPEAQA